MPTKARKNRTSYLKQKNSITQQYLNKQTYCFQTENVYNTLLIKCLRKQSKEHFESKELDNHSSIF